jgi:menaquinone-dependent protoporphyrinogen oxidase
MARMSQILIAHASRFGQTRALAVTIASRLRDRGHEVVIVCARDHVIPEPSEFDAVILGSRIELGHHAPEITEYIRNHREQLANMPTAFFSVSLAAAVPFAGLDPRGYLMSTFEDLDWIPNHATAFGRVGAPQAGELADLLAVQLPAARLPVAQRSAVHQPAA